jgi:large subunit ribosomal protein L21
MPRSRRWPPAEITGITEITAPAAGRLTLQRARDSFSRPAPSGFIGGPMFAVIESGGKQYRVEPGDVLDVELLAELAPVAAEPEAADVAATPAKGTAVKFERVLVVGGDGQRATAIGRPLVAGAVVTASLVGESKGPKIRVFKHKRRNTQRRTRGHRQHMHRVRIDEIQLP